MMSLLRFTFPLIALLLAACVTPDYQPVFVKQNYETNVRTRQIMVGYYSLDEVPAAKVSIAKEKLLASIECRDYVLVEDGITGDTTTSTHVDARFGYATTREYDRTYYFASYRCPNAE